MSDKPLVEIQCGTLRWRVWSDGRLMGFPGGARVVPVQDEPESGADAANRAYYEWKERVNKLR